MGYCIQQDVYRFVPAGILASQSVSRLVVAVASSDIFTLDGHGLELNQELTFRAESGGSLPSPMVAGTTYYAIPLTSNTFQISASLSGLALNITTAGSNTLVIPELPWTSWIAECDAMIDQTLVGHVVPITGTIPEPVRLYSACLLAMRVLAHVGASTSAVQGQLEFWSKQAEKWSRGVPLRGANVPAAGNLAVSYSGHRADPRGWERGTGRIP